MIDLSKLSAAELRDLQTQIGEQIKTRAEEEVANVRQQILALAQSVNMPLDEIMKVKKASQPVAARYRDPENAAQQWTGRGRQPKWVKEYLEKPGAKLDGLLIG